MENEEKRRYKKYGYLFKNTKLRKARLAGLIVTEEFEKAADAIVKSGREITDIDIYNIAKSLFFPMYKQRITEGFKESYKQQFGTAAYREWSHKFREYKQAPRAFSVDLFGSDKQWEDDFRQWELSYN